MIQEEKQLLLKDLCARLPYGVKINVNGEEDTLLELGVDTSWVNASYDIEDVKPYLRPMSSMTEEEKRTYTSLRAHAAPFTIVNWLDENHFDHRTNTEGEHLIELGIALQAPEGMYNLKEK